MRELTAFALGGWPVGFSAHEASWAVIGVLGVGYALAVNAASRVQGTAALPDRRQLVAFVGALAALAVALTWPLADLAAHWSLSALVVQRILLLLVVAPLVLRALPVGVVAWATRPAALDWLALRLARPGVAVGVVTVLLVGTLLAPVVDAAGRSSLVRLGVDVAVLFAGVALWAPVYPVVPGPPRLGAVGRAAYLFVQSVVPTFPGVVFIFARHPLYHAFLRSHAAVGLSPVADQELAGILVKVATLPVLWGTAWWILARSRRAEELGFDTGQLTWVDVERELERAERTERRMRRRRGEKPPPLRQPG
jgi:putative membrane protein